jgi:hypothetical protein
LALTVVSTPAEFDTMVYMVFPLVRFDDEVRLVQIPAVPDLGEFQDVGGMLNRSKEFFVSVRDDAIY